MIGLAAIRPDEWDVPLFLHVLGALTLIGALALTMALLVPADPEPEQQVQQQDRQPGAGEHRPPVQCVARRVGDEQDREDDLTEEVRERGHHHHRALIRMREDVAEPFAELGPQ